MGDVCEGWRRLEAEPTVKTDIVGLVFAVVAPCPRRGCRIEQPNQQPLLWEVGDLKRYHSHPFPTAPPQKKKSHQYESISTPFLSWWEYDLGIIGIHSGVKKPCDRPHV